MNIQLCHCPATSRSPPAVPCFSLLRPPHLPAPLWTSSPLRHFSLSLTPSRPLFSFSHRARKAERSKIVDAEIVVEEEAPIIGGVEGITEEEGYGEGEREEFAYASGFGGREGEKDYDRDPELADILGSLFEDPQKGQARVEERIGKKKNKILHTKTGSAKPVKVTFNKFGFSNSYIWFEFYNPLLPNDVSLICDTIRSWHIIGRLGGCNSMNMQLSQAPMDNKRPSYDAIQGANVTPTTFYNIGDFEVQENLARIWMDIGTTEPLLLDVLINALINISSDYVGIKQLVFGGSEFENWKENLTSEDAGCSVHRI